MLPVVVALVSAKPGERLFWLDNPEAHIHPKGQRILGELLASGRDAGGVQIIVETHSDHILNGIRVAAKKGKLQPEKTGMFYFYKDIKDPINIK